MIAKVYPAHAWAPRLTPCWFAVLFFTAQPLLAGTLTSGGPAVGPGLGSVSNPIIITLAANNDDFVGPGGNNNNVTIDVKQFDNLGFIDIPFDVSDSSGVTEYFFQEAVANLTGTDWISYEIQLGFGTGNSFVLSSAADGLDLDFPTPNPAPTSSAFTILNHQEDVIRWSGGVHEDLLLETLTFSVDVPDGITGFTVRQVPIPEPATGVQLLLGALLLFRTATAGHRSRR